MSSPITTHVLDTAGGRPAPGVAVTLERLEKSGNWHKVGHGHTDADGRLKALLAPGKLEVGAYRLTFDVGIYFDGRGAPTFFRHVPIEFHVHDAKQHYHVPLLISPYGYSTYRGS
jgi:5-hydroxyisourate hydrolase